MNEAQLKECREAFETYARDKGLCVKLSLCDDGGYYRNGATELAWLAYEAGVKAERERAAKVCRDKVDEMNKLLIKQNPNDDDGINQDRVYGWRDCASILGQAIRKGE